MIASISVRQRWAQLLCIALALLATSSLMALWAPPAQAQTSATTVTWAPENGELQQYQPANRTEHYPGGALEGSGKHSDFANVKVSVEQTTDLTDQVLTVTLEGLAETVNRRGTYGPTRGYASNFYQLMQCWGPDPNAADFAETCSFGGLSTGSGFSEAQELLKAASVFEVNFTRGWHTSGYFLADGTPIPPEEVDPYNREQLARQGVPFRTVQGAENKPERVVNIINGIGEFIGGTSNEQVFVHSPGGRTEVQFNVQSAAGNPYLGCGAATETGEARGCWLVVVPRGEHAGSLPNADGDTQPYCLDRSVVDPHHTTPGKPNPGYGDVAWYQAASPMEPNCSFWDDRLVVPLNFQPTALACGQGAARAIGGTEMAVPAVGSWQAPLCGGDDPALFSLTTAAPSVLSDQLGTGLTPMVLVGNEVEAGGLDEPRYAPVMNTALTLAFRIDGQQYGRVEELNLTPRLVAKMLTYSYRPSIPRISGDDRRYDQHVAGNSSLQKDPEFREINPGLPIAPEGDLYVLGPQGDAALAQLWAWIQADDDARAFLQGEPDEHGMVVNPYYLPAGHPDALGGGLPFDLATDPVDAVPKADQTLAPDEATAAELYKGQRVDAQMMNPFSETYQHIAQRVFTGDTGATRSWNPLKGNSAGEFGAWDGSPQNFFLAGGIRGVGTVDAATARRLGLNTAALRVPNGEAFVAPSDATVAAGVAALRTDAATGVGTADFAAWPKDAYPLASTVYAAVDIASTGLDAPARNDYAAFIDYAATDGQRLGQLRGQLPPGYVPLTAGQREAALSVAAELRSWRPPPATPDDDDKIDRAGGGEGETGRPSGGDAGGQAVAPADATGAADDDFSAEPENDTQVVAGAGAPGGSSSVDSPGSGALLGLLAAALAGLAATPLLLRRRRGAR